ncbi:MAG: YdcF family protein [Micavibrio aeruginosavorus]|uniref:YdcF family protein n=1 Tax=Micavibrio aeruginosavorus TaxID=349221 RepID=A0A2W5HPY2_9BACT|nr:MAG: YdcF family protein [Micavibrio aeruginosavorus]
MFKLFKWFTGFLAGIIALVFIIWIGGFIMFTGIISSMNEPKTVKGTDAIIVLTGGTNRVMRALDLLSDGKAKYLLISGVNKDVKLKELTGRWGYKKPLPDCCITLGYQAETTLGNAIESREWVRENKIKTVRLITATYHMPRSALEFHHALPDTEIIRHAVIPENFMPDGEKFWKICFLEYHKFLISIVRVLFYPTEVNQLPSAMK